MKIRIFIFMAILAIAGIIAGCSMPANQVSKDDKQGKELISNLSKTTTQGAQSADLPDGDYLIKNRWTGEYLNWSHKIAYNSSDFYLERGTGPIDDTYVWGISKVYNPGNNYWNIWSYDKNLGQSKWLNFSTATVTDAAHVSAGPIIRWSDDPNVANSASPIGPYALGDSMIYNCERQSTINGVGIVDIDSTDYVQPGWWSKDWYFIPKKMYLESAANGKVVAADYAVNRNGPLNASKSNIGAWEGFYLRNNADGTISFQSSINNYYVCADLNINSNDGPLNLNRTAVGLWETFDLIINPDFTISLRSRANNNYVCAEVNMNNSPLNANRTAIGPWEKFILNPEPF